MSIKLTESEKLECKLMRMFEHHFRHYRLDFTIANEPVHLYNNKNKYIGKTEYYVTKETYLLFQAYQAGYLKGKK